MGGGPDPREQGENARANEELVREVRKVRDEIHDVRREIERIADALENRN
jgi:hypothetical protein